jgi:hypothetical protein
VAEDDSISARLISSVVLITCFVMVRVVPLESGDRGGRLHRSFAAFPCGFRPRLFYLACSSLFVMHCLDLTSIASLRNIHLVCRFPCNHSKRAGSFTRGAFFHNHGIICLLFICYCCHIFLALYSIIHQHSLVCSFLLSPSFSCVLFALPC